MSKPDFWSDSETAKVVSKQYDDLKKEAGIWQKLTDNLAEILELSKIFDSSGELEAHQFELTAKLQQLQAEYDRLEFAVLFSDKYDKENAVLSVHAGTGGVDAMDWAQMLVRMYLRFCERHGFEAKIIDETAGGEAGIKSATIEVTGRYAYGWLKSEGGVHRLVRISPFDAEKMRHTSFALVEVLPELEEIESVEIKDEDIKVDVFRAGGHGGQSVNTTDSAVRLTHLPTGITVKCQNERSQLQNKNKALKILKSKLLQYYQEAAGEKKEKIKGEYRQAQWGNQARSYVLQPYRLVKDHRTDYETADTDRVLGGEIDDFVGAYLKQQAGK
jgi:peptide chain release factor 2